MQESTLNDTEKSAADIEREKSPFQNTQRAIFHTKRALTDKAKNPK